MQIQVGNAAVSLHVIERISEVTCPIGGGSVSEDKIYHSSEVSFEQSMSDLHHSAVVMGLRTCAPGKWVGREVMAIQLARPCSQKSRFLHQRSRSPAELAHGVAKRPYWFS